MIKVVNMRGTMVACYSGTQYTPDEAADATFNKLQAEVWSIYTGLMPANSRDRGAVAEAVNKFNEDTKVNYNIGVMETIVDKIVKGRQKQKGRHENV
jgi:hypothetical protein